MELNTGFALKLKLVRLFLSLQETICRMALR
nr:MAG TPA: hypothetical protein [Caudoviricetes sp.]